MFIYINEGDVDMDLIKNNFMCGKTKYEDIFTISDLMLSRLIEFSLDRGWEIRIKKYNGYLVVYIVDNFRRNRYYTEKDSTFSKVCELVGL